MEGNGMDRTKLAAVALVEMEKTAKKMTALKKLLTMLLAGGAGAGLAQVAPLGEGEGVIGDSIAGVSRAINNALGRTPDRGTPDMGVGSIAGILSRIGLTGTKGMFNAGKGSEDANLAKALNSILGGLEGAGGEAAHGATQAVRDYEPLPIASMLEGLGGGLGSVGNEARHAYNQATHKPIDLSSIMGGMGDSFSNIFQGMNFSQPKPSAGTSPKHDSPMVSGTGLEGLFSKLF